MYSIQQQTLANISLDDDTQRITPSKDPFYFEESKIKVHCVIPFHKNSSALGGFDRDDFYSIPGH
jgi:hypothetical protein